MRNSSGPYVARYAASPKCGFASVCSPLLCPVTTQAGVKASFLSEYCLRPWGCRQHKKSSKSRRLLQSRRLLLLCTKCLVVGVSSPFAGAYYGDARRIRSATCAPGSGPSAGRLGSPKMGGRTDAKGGSRMASASRDLRVSRTTMRPDAGSGLDGPLCGGSERAKAANAPLGGGQHARLKERSRGCGASRRQRSPRSATRV
jgi:hypothetical protein